MTKTLLKSYQREHYFRQLLENKSGLLNVNVSNLQNEFDYDSNNDFVMLLNIHKIISDMPLTVLEPYKHTLTLHKQILQLYKIMHVYQISIDNLPTDFKKNQEIKSIMEQVFPLKSIYLDKLNKFINKNDNYNLIEHYVSDPIQLKIVSSAKSIFNVSLLNRQLPNDVFAYRAKNARVEVEGIAQEILNKKYDIEQVMIINNDKNYYPIIKQVFSRYNLPYSIVSDQDDFIFIKKYLSLLGLIKNPSIKNLLSCFDFNCFNTANNYKLHKIVSFFNFQFSDFLNYDFSSYQPSDSKETKYLLELISDSLVDIDNIKTFLHKILDEEDFTKLNTLIYDYISISVDKTEINGFNTLKNKLEFILPLITLSSNKFELLQDSIKSIKKSIPFKTKGVITVTDNTSFYLNKDIVFITGCNSKDFFNLTTYKGLIDEHYLSLIPFLSYRERYENHNNHLNTMFNIGKTLYVSYSYSDYSGGKKELAFEVENIIKELSIKLNKNIAFESLNIIENDYIENKTYTIEPLLYNQLILKDDILIGSVSSFEQYIGCPYAYFLKRGLGLSVQNLPEINYAVIGNLVHDTLNQLAKSFGENYSTVENSQINDIVRNQFIHLKSIYPFASIYLKFIEERFVELIQENIKHLLQLESNTSFKIYETEKYFDTQINNVNIRGIIDRVDITETYFRVIDYKTGPKSFNLKQVLSGQQLQLLTYLYIAKDIYNLKPMGAYYYAVNLPTININNYTVNFSKHILDSVDEELQLDAYNSSKRLDGITFGDASILDYSGKYVKLPRSKENYDFEKVNQYITEMYTYIYEKVKSGDISCEPLEETYALNDYQVIAQYKGKARKALPIVSITDFKENDNEMES